MNKPPAFLILRVVDLVNAFCPHEKSFLNALRALPEKPMMAIAKLPEILLTDCDEGHPELEDYPDNDNTPHFLPPGL
jgi:hypothetical protein